MVHLTEKTKVVFDFQVFKYFSVCIKTGFVGQFIVSDMNEILSLPRKFLYRSVDYVKLTNIQIQKGKRSSETNFRQLSR